MAAIGTMRAFVTDGKASGSIKNIPRPVPDQGEILVKVHSVALNPADWKLVEGTVLSSAPPGLIVGFDFAGTVEESNGTQWKKGQRVGGWVHGVTYPNIGSFAEFVAIQESLVFAIPDNTSFQQASTISLAFATAAQAVWQHLNFPEPDQPKLKQVDFLVYGASTSVGLYAVQLGKLSGARVIAVASTKNHDFLKKLGADVTVDYRDENWVDQVRENTGGELPYALDCIADGESAKNTARALMTKDGARLISLSFVDKSSVHAVNPHAKVEAMIALTVFGRALPEAFGAFDNAGGETLEDQRLWEKWLKLATKMLEKGDLQPNPVREVGTLDDTLAAFRLSKEGKLSAEKAVLNVVQEE